MGLSVATAMKLMARCRLMRVRQMTQDDAHIFCREDQIIDEAVGFCGLVTQVYEDLGFNDVSAAGLVPTCAGDDAVWDWAENGLRDIDSRWLEWEELSGEGAFYGPKINITFAMPSDAPARHVAAGFCRRALGCELYPWMAKSTCRMLHARYWAHWRFHRHYD